MRRKICLREIPVFSPPGENAPWCVGPFFCTSKNKFFGLVPQPLLGRAVPLSHFNSWEYQRLAVSCPASRMGVDNPPPPHKTWVSSSTSLPGCFPFPAHITIPSLGPPRKYTTRFQGTFRVPSPQRFFRVLTKTIPSPSIRRFSPSFPIHGVSPEIIFLPCFPFPFSVTP